MKRRDIAIVLSKYFGRYPTIVEVNYFDRTGIVKESSKFTEEEHLQYNPTPRTLERSYNFIVNCLYTHHNADKIKAKMAREEIKKAERDYRISREIAKAGARQQALYRKWGEQRVEQMKTANEEYLKKQIDADNKRRILDILKYHGKTPDMLTADKKTWESIPEEMRDVIKKYK